MQMLNIGSKFDASSDPWQNGFGSGTISYESRSVGNYLDPDQFDASSNSWEMIWIRISLMQV